MSKEQAEVEIIINAKAERFHEKYPHFDLNDSEYMATCTAFYRELLRFDGLMLHASAVVLDGKAYLFSAKSGTGKSTHTGLWQQVFGAENARILNDDKPALRFEDGRWYAYGTPWSGKYDISLNERVPVAGICMLERAEQNSIERFGGPAAIYAIMEQTLRPNAPELRRLLMQNLDLLLRNVPVYRLRCNMEPEAAVLSHKVMCENAPE